MPILTNIQSIPLFSTPIEAINWGRQYGLKGYHKHAFGIRTGYMAGSTHGQVKKMYAKKNYNPARPSPTRSLRQNPNASPSPTQNTPTASPPTRTEGDGGY